MPSEEELLYLYEQAAAQYMAEQAENAILNNLETAFVNGAFDELTEYVIASNDPANNNFTIDQAWDVDEYDNDDEALDDDEEYDDYDDDDDEEWDDEEDEDYDDDDDEEWDDEEDEESEDDEEYYDDDDDEDEDDFGIEMPYLDL